MRRMAQLAAGGGQSLAGRFSARLVFSAMILALGAGVALGQQEKPKRPPYYEVKSPTPPKPLPPLDLRGLAPREAVGEILKRRDFRSTGDTADRSLRMAGCMHCHSSLGGITVGEFSRHVDTRQSYYRCKSQASLVGVDLSAAFGQPDSTGNDELKKAIDASGQPVRPAGSMASELAREKWEASQREAAAKDVEASKSDWERAITLISQGKYDLALPPLKAHVARQIADERAAMEQASRALAENQARNRETGQPAGAAPGATDAQSAGTSVTSTQTPKSPVALEDTKRLLAFVLVATHQPDAGSAVVREMYRSDPRLARRPFHAEDFGISDHQLHDAFASSVTFGHRAKTGSSWLLAAMFAQAERKLPLARTLIDRGVANGLERDIADSFAVAIDETIEAEKAQRATPSKPESTRRTSHSRTIPK